MDIFQALNTPRQITEYREWPGDKKGCLFYVPFTDFYENGFGAICLIDAPWRKNDKIGTHNLLHECEWDMAEHNCIVCGYGAFLIQWNWAAKYAIDVDEGWRIYKEWVEKSMNVNWDDEPMEFLTIECQKWLKRHKRMLYEYCSSENYEGDSVDSLFNATIDHLVKQMSMDMPTMMWNMEPYLGYYVKNSSNYIQPQIEIIQTNKDGYEALSGFCEVITNYLASFYVFEKLEGGILKDDMEPEEWIYNAFTTYRDIAPTIVFNEVFFCVDGPDIQAMLDCYKRKKEELMVAQLKKDIDYALCRSDEAKHLLTIHSMFMEETYHFPNFNDEAYDYLSNSSKEYLTFLYIAYMRELLEQLKDSQFYDEDKKYLLDNFPELISPLTYVEAEKRNHTASVKKAKTISNPLGFIPNQQYLNEILNKLKVYIIGKTTSKDIMMPIRAAMDSGIINRPSYSQVRYILRECLGFSDNQIPNKTSINDYTNSLQNKYNGEAYRLMVEDFKTINK